ncbi:MFS transporter [Vagococcus carniphilus]|uniref:MFS transporter n=1 Tax=Vagococcus carniphilus TaxID=218144 RepID=UPI00288E0A69|nr:MFS transporter [Vagococcus carniphilus]MDT2829346.1 MFS transporter [Vagococcus carniphilus]MDT2838805.1 MFS transporter [Vagococcus carniphilus]MDT2852863.1 MFS transporter [Vagococcus carniphilus]
MENVTKQNSARAHIIEIIMFLSYAFFAVNWIVGTTLTPQIMEHFDLKSFSSATFISNAITVAKIIGNLMAAKVLIKLYPKKAISLAGLLIVSGSFLGVFAPTYWIFVVARFIMGFGGALFVVYFGPIVMNYYSADKRATINGINAAAYNVGSILAMIIVAPVINWLVTWQKSMMFFAICSLILMIAWFIFGEDFEVNKPASSDVKTEDEYTLGQALKEKFSYVFPFTYAGLLTLYIVVLTIFPISDGAPVDPKFLSATVAIAGVVGAAVGIGAAKKFSKRLPVIRWSGLLMSLAGLTMVLTSSTTVALIAAAFLGFFMFVPMTALVTIPQEMPGMTPSKLTLIMGIFWSFSYIFETFFYYVIGVIIDKSGFKAGLLLAVGLSFTFFIGSFLLPETGNNKK